MKKVIVVIIFCFAFVLNVSSQNNVFLSRPNCEQNGEIEIKSNSNIDSLNGFITKENKANFNISLRGLNETQMDSMLNLFKHPMKIDKIYLDSCPIKKLPIVFRKFYRLRDLQFYKCDSIESFNGLKSIQPSFALKFIFCDIPKLPDGIENIKSILSLIIVVDKDYKTFDLEESLSKLTYRNNIRACCIVDNNLMNLPKSLDKLTLLSHLILLGNKNMKIVNKLSNLFNLIDFMGNIETDKILDSLTIDNLFYESSIDMDLKSESEFYNIIYDVLSTNIPYYYNHFAFYKKDIFLNVKYRGSGYKYLSDNLVSRDIDTLKYEIILDDNFFHIEKQFYVKTFLLKYLKLDSEKIAKVKFVHPYNDEEILSFELKSGDEYLVNLENYKDIYFNIEFEIDGKKYIRNVEMK